MVRALLAAAGMILLAAAPAPLAAHGDEDHGAAPAQEAAPAVGGDDFPFTIGGPFSLTDHTGASVTEADFRGRYMLVFFGYTNCEAMCPVGLRAMLEAMEHLGERAEAVRPVMITVDPEHDTPAVLADYVADLHPRLVGLTGTPEALAETRKAFKVNAEAVNEGLLSGKPIFSHGSYIYLMGPEGGFLSLLPPILPPEEMADIIAGHMDRAES